MGQGSARNSSELKSSLVFAVLIRSPNYRWCQPSAARRFNCRPASSEMSLMDSAVPANPPYWAGTTSRASAVSCSSVASCGSHPGTKKFSETGSPRRSVRSRIIRVHVAVSPMMNAPESTRLSNALRCAAGESGMGIPRIFRYRSRR